MVRQHHSVTVQWTSMFTFKPDIPTCDVYSFTVTAVNEAGPSEPSKAMADTLPTRM